VSPTHMRIITNTLAGSWLLCSTGKEGEIIDRALPTRGLLPHLRFTWRGNRVD
jgi:hypothetical protein